MLNRTLLGLAVACSAALAVAAAAPAEAPKPMCPVSGHAADKDNAVAYKGAEVYFCCKNCPKAFEADTAKFASKANHQLVVTDQAKQVKCPVSGAKLNPEQFTTVAGTKVEFCCGNCKGKVEKADEKEQIDLVFADKPFDKAYEVKKAEKK